MRKEFIFEQLTGKDPVLYVKSKGVEDYSWGLWLRCVQEWFYPCKKCDTQIDELFQTSEVFSLHKDHDFPSLYVLRKRATLNIEVLSKFIAFCTTCSEKLFDLLQSSHKWILGNKDYSPPVELQYKDDIVDDAWVELERRPATEEEKIRLKDEYYD